MQREGDELDAAIRRSERETAALVATLAHLNDRNTALRSVNCTTVSHIKDDQVNCCSEALHVVEPGSEEAGAIRALENRAKEVQVCRLSGCHIVAQ